MKSIIETFEEVESIHFEVDFKEKTLAKANDLRFDFSKKVWYITKVSYRDDFEDIVNHNIKVFKVKKIEGVNLTLAHKALLKNSFNKIYTKQLVMKTNPTTSLTDEELETK